MVPLNEPTAVRVAETMTISVIGGFLWGRESD
jgi:hypothetical protein